MYLPSWMQPDLRWPDDGFGPKGDMGSGRSRAPKLPLICPSSKLPSSTGIGANTPFARSDILFRKGTFLVPDRSVFGLIPSAQRRAFSAGTGTARKASGGETRPSAGHPYKQHARHSENEVALFKMQLVVEPDRKVCFSVAVAVGIDERIVGANFIAKFTRLVVKIGIVDKLESLVSG